MIKEKMRLKFFLKEEKFLVKNLDGISEMSIFALGK